MSVKMDISMISELLVMTNSVELCMPVFTVQCRKFIVLDLYFIEYEILYMVLHCKTVVQQQWT